MLAQASLLALALLARAEPVAFTLAVTGDFIPARGLNAAVVESGDFSAPLAGVAPVLTAADVAFVDLEAPLLATCKVTRAGMKFCGDVRWAAALANAGVDVVTLANNHINNHGPAGSAETRRAGEAAGLAVTGAVRGATPPAIIDVNGARVAFLGFNVVSVGHADRAAMRASVEAARVAADVVVVQVHWGREYVDVPERTPGLGAPDAPRALARLLVRAGADLVVGNHPHHIQGHELIHVEGRVVPVVYAHGNLLFDQLFSRRTRESVIGLYRFEGRRVVDVSFVPVRQDAWRARVLEGADADAVKARVERLSRALRLNRLSGSP